MTKKTKSAGRTRKNTGMSISSLANALDLMLSGHNTVVGRDFIMTKRDPFNADIGHLNPEDLRTFDQNFVDTLIQFKAAEEPVIPDNLEQLGKSYLNQRELLSAWHPTESLLLKHDIKAARELGNFDPYLEKVVIRNNAEMNFFYDYIALFRKVNGKRCLTDWRLENPGSINRNNEKVVTACEKARFAVLRLDKNLAHGGILATNIISGKSHILIDRALNRSHKQGYFFICSILDMGEYVMTSNGGVHLDPSSDAAKSTLTLLKKHMPALQAARSVLNKNIAECVREIYGFCLRGGALQHMTVG